MDNPQNGKDERCRFDDRTDSDNAGRKGGVETWGSRSAGPKLPLSPRAPSFVAAGSRTKTEVCVWLPRERFAVTYTHIQTHSQSLHFCGGEEASAKP